ncbi:MAG: HipA domain-containing protein, partial [Alloacidobacterium sp.]
LRQFAAGQRANPPPAGGAGEGRGGTTPTAFWPPSAATAWVRCNSSPTGRIPDRGGIEARPLQDKAIANLLGDLKRRPLGVDEIGEFRISLGGAQKTALLNWQDQWQVPHGSTLILKPEIGRLESGIDFSQSIENEHLCMRLTASFGLPTARTEIREFSGRRALVVERFDRLHTRDGRLLRLPQEDCCQALSVPPPRKYEPDGGPGMRQILDLLKASDEPEADQTIFLKAQIVFWLLGATDGHAKNFSIFLLPGGRFRLTPLYDVMSSPPNVDAGEIRHNAMKLAMAVGDNRHYIIDSIVPRHFLQTAARCGVSVSLVQGILDQIENDTDRAIDTAVNDQSPGFPERIVSSVIEGVRWRLSLFGRTAASA